MRAIFIFDTLDLGGAERQGLLLARALRARGDEVQIWGLTGRPGRLAELCAEQGLTWRAVELIWKRELVRVPHDLWALHRLAHALRSEHPDVLLPYTYFSNVIAGLVWRRTGARTCVWNQRDAGLYLDRFDPWRAAATRLVRDYVANSEAGRMALARVTSRPVTVVHNGVELAPARDDRRTWRARLGAGSFVAAMVANLHAHKDHATLLQAWKLVVERVPDALLALAGREEETGPAVRALVENLGLTERVRFLGPTDDVAGLYAASDLYVHASTSEGFPNAVIEAMAAGLPVVATDLPGVREAVGEVGRPYLVPAGDAVALASQVLALHADPARAKELGKSAAAYARDELSASRMCETMVRYLSSRS